MTAADRPGPVRVAQLITSLARGGAQATVLASRQLAEHGVEVTILAGRGEPGEPSHWDELRAAGAAVVEVPALTRDVSPVADLRAAIWLHRWLRRHRPDVLHTHSSKAGVLGRLASSSASVPVAHTVHGWSFAPHLPWPAAPAAAPRRRSRLAAAVLVRLERQLARLTDALVVVSPVDGEQGLALGIGRPDQYRVIRSGVDLDEPRAGRSRRDQTRRALGLDRQFVVGTVGRLAPQKDLATLIDGFALAGVPASRVVLVGDGPQRSELVERAKAAGVDGRVQLIGHRPDAARLVAAFDVFVLPSRWEGLPRALVEAVAAGVPVVATPVGGVPELIRHGRTGTLIPAGDPEALAAALVDQARSPRHHRAMAERAGAEIEAFSAARMRADLAELWLSLAGRGRAAGGPRWERGPGGGLQVAGR